LGVAPAHFNGAICGTFFPSVACSDIWQQYAWQANDRVSREHVAQAIFDAEYDIARVLGYYPAPTWVSQEVQQIPQHWRRDATTFGNFGVAGRDRSMKADWGRIIAPGVRKISYLNTVAVAYTDQDGDGFKETATVSIGTTLTNECEIKVYFVGHNGEPEWEIRPARYLTATGVTFTAVFYTWQLIDPDLWEAFPTSVIMQAIDCNVVTNLVTNVEVYKECNDSEEVSAEFYWNADLQSSSISCSVCGGTGCPSCRFITQDGCLNIAEPNIGLVSAHPATYNTSTGEWQPAVWAVCRTPDFVKIWYYCGALSEKWLSGQRCEMLSDSFAHAIAWLATARLARPLCACSNVAAQVEYLQEDLAETHQGGSSHFLSMDLVGNPFGTRRGEVKAWQRIRHLCDNLLSVGVI
jgi:hypothetical protein